MLELRVKDFKPVIKNIFLNTTFFLPSRYLYYYCLLFYFLYMLFIAHSMVIIFKQRVNLNEKKKILYVVIISDVLQSFV